MKYRVKRFSTSADHFSKFPVNLSPVSESEVASSRKVTDAGKGIVDSITEAVSTVLDNKRSMGPRKSIEGQLKLKFPGFNPIDAVPKKSIPSKMLRNSRVFVRKATPNPGSVSYIDRQIGGRIGQYTIGSLFNLTKK